MEIKLTGQKQAFVNDLKKVVIRNEVVKVSDEIGLKLICQGKFEEVKKKGGKE